MTRKGQRWTNEQRSKLAASMAESRRRRDPSVEDRFWSKVDKNVENDNCWQWKARLNHQGYGGFRFRGEFRLAHRVAWELTNGPIPAGMGVLHHCDNPRCVRPSHLWLGDNSDNQRDSAMKGRRVVLTGELNAHAKLTNEQARCIYNRAWSGERLVELACEYNVSPEAISAIKCRRNFRHATEESERQRISASARQL